MGKVTNDWCSMDDALEIAFTFDERGDISYQNDAAQQMLAYGMEQTHISEIFPSDFIRKDTGFDTTIEFGDKLQKLMAYRKNRTCFLVEARIKKVSDKPLRYLCMANDISRIHALEKEVNKVAREAEDAMRIKSEFVANITHELRTPVNGVLGNTRELMAIETDKEKQRIMLLIERCCRDMNVIINNILDFSKLEAGKFTIENREFDLRNMIDYVKANHIHRITEKGLDFFVTVSPEVPQTIIGDELRIVQVLNNLLSNACKFTSLGKITLEVLKTAQSGKKVELFFLVADTGEGIDKADRDKLFKSFSQVDASISRKHGGTGLGLYICKQLVELMGGNINVESEKNKGSMFTFSIWVEISGADAEMAEDVHVDTRDMIKQLQNEFVSQENAQRYDFGKKENLEEIQKKLSKLILSVEMENWEKAEMFIDTIRQLTQEAPKEIKNGVLKLKMAVQKENYEKVVKAHEVLTGLLEQL